VDSDQQVVNNDLSLLSRGIFSGPLIPCIGIAHCIAPMMIVLARQAGGELAEAIEKLVGQGDSISPCYSSSTRFVVRYHQSSEVNNSPLFREQEW